MPQKKKKEAESSSDTSLNNSSEDESKKPAKKQKTEKESKSSSSKDDGEKNWDLGNKKSVRINEFRGRMFVDIREYYMDKNDGEMKPGRKGIALSAEQWQKLKSVIKDVDEALKQS